MPQASHPEHTGMKLKFCSDDHQRFRGVPDCTNGCLACEAELLRKRVAFLEGRVSGLRDKIAEYYGQSNA